MRRLRRIALLVGSAVLVGTLAMSGIAVGGGKGGKTITLTLGPPDPANVEEIDLGEPGQSPGDMLIGHGDLFQDGTKVGFVRFTCVWNFGTGVMCTNHATLFERGQLVTQQSGDPAEGPVVVEAITGGTGEFRNARGQARVDFAEGTVTYRVIG